MVTTLIAEIIPIPDFLPDNLKIIGWVGVLILSAFISTLTGVRHFYKQKTDELEKKITELKRRIGDLPSITKLSLTRNKDLKTTILNFVKRYRKYLENRIKKEAEYGIFTSDLFDLERQNKEIPEENRTLIQRLHLQISEDIKLFDEGFRSDAILYKKELMERLPLPSKCMPIITYEKPIDSYKYRGLGTSLIGKIIDDLEELAKSLPT
jgi:hypothetical protein